MMDYFAGHDRIVATRTWTGSEMVTKKETSLPALATDTWISPAQAMDMLFDDPMGGTPGFGFALLRPRSKQRRNRVADLIRAKLQPRQPADDATWMGVPVTAHRADIVLAPGVPDIDEPLLQWLSRYDDAVPAHQRLLAVVLTPRFSVDMPPHDMMSAARSYAELNLSRARRLTSFISLHLPSEFLSAREPHCHITVLARVHLPCGFGHVHPDLARDEAAQPFFFEEWQGFAESWAGTLKGSI